MLASPQLCPVPPASRLRIGACRCEVGYNTDVTCRTCDAQPTCHSNGSSNGCQFTGVVGHTLLDEFVD